MTSKKRLHILLADDGSQHARSAVELLRDFSLPARSRVMVLRVFNPAQISGLSEFENSLEKTKSQLSNAGIAVETNLMLGSGSPAEKIIEMAETDKSDLIVLGAKGLRATLGILLGGVAQQVVEYAECPVLVVRAPYKPLKHILVVTDGSPHSLLAARYLSKFPLPENVNVRVMHVMSPVVSPLMMEPFAEGWQTTYIPLPAHEVEALQNKQEKKGQAILKRTCDLLQRTGIAATPIFSHGDAATEIIEYVKSNEIDLIVAGSRGLSQFKGWWMGSVSRKLVHYSNCSVLIVKAPKKA